jgi:hypothetical protein
MLFDAEGAYIGLLSNTPWSADSHAALRRLITETVPAGEPQKSALARISSLDPDKEPGAGSERWAELEKNGPTADKYQANLVGVLQNIGCAETGAPEVAKKLSRQIEYRFYDDSVRASRLAEAFLSEKCAGARGLSEEVKADLRKIRDSALPQSPEKATAGK